MLVGLRSRRPNWILGVLAGILLAVPAQAAAVGADAIPGPINARVVSVYDGDTLTVDAEPWPGLTARKSVRVAGVDTPEIRGKCQTEKDQAIRARDFVRATVGATVRLTNIRPGKYASRVIADVWVRGRKLSDLLIAENLGGTWSMTPWKRARTARNSASAGRWSETATTPPSVSSVAVAWPQRRVKRQHFRARTSTRLNPSHKRISYPVLCLTKKKTNNRQQGGG